MFRAILFLALFILPTTAAAQSASLKAACASLQAGAAQELRAAGKGSERLDEFIARTDDWSRSDLERIRADIDRGGQDVSPNNRLYLLCVIDHKLGRASADSSSPVARPATGGGLSQMAGSERSAPSVTSPTTKDLAGVEGHHPDYLVNECLAPVDGQDGHLDIQNNCAFDITAVWCVEGIDCQRGFTNMAVMAPHALRTMPGRELGLRAVKAAACRGKDSVNVTSALLARGLISCGEPAR